MGKTAQQWWDEVKNDVQKLNGWLVRQHRGEATASNRIVAFADKYAPDVRTKRILYTIASQENIHASWIQQLLTTRGLDVNVSDPEKRYWKETLPQVDSFSTGAAVGAHAEGMRLERIKVIASDESAPQDIREMFARILKDELFHEEAFREMAGVSAMELTVANHRRGRKVLGLEP